MQSDPSDYLLKPRRMGSPNTDESILTRIRSCCRPKRVYTPRTIDIGRPSKTQSFPCNKINNQKYNPITFIPIVLFEQFSVFLNLVFLILACSQFIPQLRVGYLYTYWGPLMFVVAVTMCREAIDDVRRWLRDREVNSTSYTKISHRGQTSVSSANIKVGDLLYFNRGDRIPADMVLLWTSDKNGTCYIRTDQLDGETDWKLRHAVPVTQQLVMSANGRPESVLSIQAQVYAEAPHENVYSFEGTFTRTDIVFSTPSHSNAASNQPLPADSKQPVTDHEVSLSLEHTLWANTVLSSGHAIGLVIYTGYERHALMNANKTRTKVGKLDQEVNNMTKVLVTVVLVMAFVMVGLKGFSGSWYTYLWRFLVLFSYIIPLALRVNLDMSKIVYAFLMTRDPNLAGCVVRSTTIPEELGRISFLLSDKTGTLTENEMLFRKLHLGNVAYAPDSMEEVVTGLRQFTDLYPDGPHCMTNSSDGESQPRATRRTGLERLMEAVMAVALCHNVTPMHPDDEPIGGEEKAILEAAPDPIGYQASSPDEVSLVTWTASVGMALVFRDQHSISIRLPNSKRMGIIVRHRVSGQITFYVKGAEVVLVPMVTYTDWLNDEAGNLAREGLRTLAVASRTLTTEQYDDFAQRYHTAKMSVHNRVAKMQAEVATLEHDLEVLCLTGVEDKLQDGVRSALEALRSSGIRIWMLTGDKQETAECIAKSSRLVGPGQPIYTFHPVNTRMEAHYGLNSYRRRCEQALLISGSSLEVCLRFYEPEFIDLASQAPAVIVWRCSPLQKSQAVQRLRAYNTSGRVAAIGDAANDVGMIRAADVGLGIAGKEGHQASLASDFSLVQFQQINRLLQVHGRNAYKNTSVLALFVIHRGTIITIMQAIFSTVFFFVAIPLFPSILLVGYATIFTMFPVFSMVLDKDVPDNIAMNYPELYKASVKGRELTYKTFLIWLLISVYQGGTLMFGALLLFEEEFIHVVSITFTALLITELVMVGVTIRTWHLFMILAEIISLAMYGIAMLVMTDYFDRAFLVTYDFFWRTAVITVVSIIPIIILKLIHYKLRPSIYSKLK